MPDPWMAPMHRSRATVSRRLRRSARVTAGAAAVLALATGCSNGVAAVNKEPHLGSGTASPVGGVQQITVRTGEDYRFHPSTIVVHPGRVRIILINTAKVGAPHNLQLPSYPGADVPLVQAGETESTTFVAPAPGRYRTECSIHVRQGQVGWLIVRPR